MALIILSWLLLIFYGIQYNKHCDNDPFNFQHSIALRGICSVEIMIGHLGLPMATNSIFLYPNRKAGILFVGIFFALSGYGLIYSLKNKNKYMNHFLGKRIVKILFPAYLIYVKFQSIKLYKYSRLILLGGGSRIIDRIIFCLRRTKCDRQSDRKKCRIGIVCLYDDRYLVSF